jgi:hypothetical protein
VISGSDQQAPSLDLLIVMWHMTCDLLVIFLRHTLSLTKMASNTLMTNEHAKDVLSAKQRPWKPNPMPHLLLNLFPVQVPQTLEIATRPCTQCKCLVPFTQKLKACEKCRRKDVPRKAARCKGASDESMKWVSELVDVDESEEEGGIEGKGWDQMRKRIKMEFGDAKRKRKVPIVKNIESKVHSLLYSPHLNSKIY